jgi:hypothetical protein
LLMILVCGIGVMQLSTAFAYTTQDAINLVTGNDSSSWISMDNPGDSLKFRSGGIYKLEVRKFNPEGYSDITVFQRNDAPIVLNIQYNAREGKYYAYAWLGACKGELLSRSGYYRN